MACALLVSSALLVRTVGQMMETPTGVDADDVTISTVQLSPSAVGAPARGGTIETVWFPVADVHGRILDEIRQQPGVMAAGHSNRLPLEVGWRNPFHVEGQPRPGRVEDLPQAQFLSVSEGFFEAMGAQLTSGRAFTAFDNRDSIGAVIVNESFARRYLADGNPVGQVIRTWATGIGPLGTHLKSPPQLPAATGGHAVRSDCGREGRAQRAARPGGGARGLLHDAAVSVLGSVHRGQGRGWQRCADGNPQCASQE